MGGGGAGCSCGVWTNAVCRVMLAGLRSTNSPTPASAAAAAGVCAVGRHRHEPISSAHTRPHAGAPVATAACHAGPHVPQHMCVFPPPPPPRPPFCIPVCYHPRSSAPNSAFLPPTCAPQNSLGGVGSGVTTMTSSPASRRVLMRDSKRFFMPLMWLKGLGSTNRATLRGV